jgi:hypothetical protein
MIKVRGVEARPEHKLAVRFSDGTRGVVDFRPLLEKAPFRALRNEKVFAEAYVDHGAVEWPCDVGIASEALYAMAHGMKVPETLEEARANEFEMSLGELRKLAGVTQVDAAGAMAMDQGQLSRFERQEDRKLSTLRRYVEALGGELEVVAVLGDKRIVLRGV